MPDASQVVCPHCDQVNRVPADKDARQGRCGQCHQPLFDGTPAVLDADRLRKHIQSSGVPILVDFWAEWCGPCRTMAPVFANAAGQLEPRVRLAKVDVDAAGELATSLGIRSIPTMVLFAGGRELGRIVGITDLRRLLAWVDQQLSAAAA